MTDTQEQLAVRRIHLALKIAYLPAVVLLTLSSRLYPPLFATGEEEVIGLFGFLLFGMLGLIVAFAMTILYVWLFVSMAMVVV